MSNQTSNTAYVEQFICPRCRTVCTIRSTRFDQARRELKRAGRRWLGKAWVYGKCAKEETDAPVID